MPSAAALTPYSLGATGAVAILSQSAEQYSTSTYYAISIAPPAGAGVQLRFSLFETESGYDKVSIYNDTTLTQSAATALVVAQSGSSSGLAVLGAADVVLTVVLSTDTSQNGAGLAFSAVACFVQADGSCLGLTSASSTLSASPTPTGTPTRTSTPTGTPTRTSTPRASGVLGGRGSAASTGDQVSVGVGATFGVLFFLGIVVAVAVFALRAQQRAKGFGGPMMTGPSSTTVVVNSPLSMAMAPPGYGMPPPGYGMMPTNNPFVPPPGGPPPGSPPGAVRVQYVSQPPMGPPPGSPPYGAPDVFFGAPPRM